jgi:transposase
LNVLDYPFSPSEQLVGVFRPIVQPTARPLEIVKRTDKQGGFKLIRRRWVIERTFSWLRRNRRLMAHYEAIASIAEGLAKLAMISLMLKRITKTKPQTTS